MEDMSLKEKIDKLYEKFEENEKKEFKVGRKGKLSKGKLKKGFSIIMRIDDNGNIEFEKQQMKDSTYRLSTGEYHSAKPEDILYYKGKPLIIQPVKKINPYNPLEGKNETYGQKYIMARMLSDVIKVKGAKANWIIWIIIIGAIGLGINYIIKGG